MRFVSTFILFFLSNCFAFAYHVTDIDLLNNNNWGSLIIDGAIILFIFIFFLIGFLLFIGRAFNILSKKRYTFNKRTVVSKNKEYLKLYLKLERDSHDFYTPTSSFIYAEDTMDTMRENGNVLIADPDEHYIKCDFNVFADYRKIRLLRDNNVYYAKID